MDRDEAGAPVKVWLRSRLDFGRDGAVFEGWEPSGARTTILTKIAERAAR